MVIKINSQSELSALVKAYEVCGGNFTTASYMLFMVVGAECPERYPFFLKMGTDVTKGQSATIFIDPSHCPLILDVPTAVKQFRNQVDIPSEVPKFRLKPIVW